MSTFDEDLFLKGLEQRRATLGEDYVQRSLDGADDFTRPFQEAMTAWCWGFGWGDEAIDARTRSMINLAMIGALGKMTEWELHCRGALTNGVTKEEIRAIIHVGRHLLRCTASARMLPGRADGAGGRRRALIVRTIFRSASPYPASVRSKTLNSTRSRSVRSSATCLTTRKGSPFRGNSQSSFCQPETGRHAGSVFQAPRPSR